MPLESARASACALWTGVGESGLVTRPELGAAPGLGLLVGEGGVAAIDLLVLGLTVSEVGGEQDQSSADDEHHASRDDRSRGRPPAAAPTMRCTPLTLNEVPTYTEVSSRRVAK